MESQLLSKLYDMGVLNSQAKLSDVDNKLTVAAFCRRRLAVFMCMSKMAETVSAVRPNLFNLYSQLISLGCKIYWAGSRPCRSWYYHRSCLSCHEARYKINLVCVFSPPLRHMEDFVTWVDTSKLKRTIMNYNDEVSDRLQKSHIFLTIFQSSTITIYYDRPSTRPQSMMSSCVLPPCYRFLADLTLTRLPSSAYSRCRSLDCLDGRHSKHVIFRLPTTQHKSRNNTAHIHIFSWLC